MLKAYIVSNTENGTDDIEGVYYLVTREGEVLASHYCSRRSYAMGDLYLNRPERINDYTSRFNEFEIAYLGSDNMTIDKLIARIEEFEADKEACES